MQDECHGARPHDLGVGGGRPRCDPHGELRTWRRRPPNSDHRHICVGSTSASTEFLSSDGNCPASTSEVRQLYPSGRPVWGRSKRALAHPDTGPSPGQSYELAHDNFPLTDDFRGQRRGAKGGRVECIASNVFVLIIARDPADITEPMLRVGVSMPCHRII